MPSDINRPRKISEMYDALVADGRVKFDRPQYDVASILDEIIDHATSKSSHTRSFRPFALATQPDRPRGLYIWGAVGRGKTMLMDLFHNCAPPPKRRVHFHTFVAEVHGSLHRHRIHGSEGTANVGDPISAVAEELARAVGILCFDEFAVTDIADAMILGRLFTALFERGVTVVTTSNVEPDRLYDEGRNRVLFLPFIKLLKDRMEVVHLDARTDFRFEKHVSNPNYHVPADAAAHAALGEAFKRASGAPNGPPSSIVVRGHVVVIPEAAGGVARFTFADLCTIPLGASDYFALSEMFHTFIVDDIPILTIARRNEAKRFINLIDTLYDQGVRLVASAAAEPSGLYYAEEGWERNEFQRTISRLREMQSDDYQHGRR